MRILVVEDNLAVAGAIKSMLERRRYAVELAPSAAAGVALFAEERFDAAILDVMLPDGDGFSLIEQVRSQGVETPVLMLTARDAIEDRVRGLESGADDYLVKPFEEEELVARLHALLRRGDRPIREVLHVRNLSIDPRARDVRVEGKKLPLGSTEFRMLELFVRNPGMTFTREHLLERLWEYDFDGSSNIVDVYVSQLRRKLRAAGVRDAIQTVWGLGYKFEP